MILYGLLVPAVMCPLNQISKVSFTSPKEILGDACTFIGACVEINLVFMSQAQTEHYHDLPINNNLPPRAISNAVFEEGLDIRGNILIIRTSDKGHISDINISDFN